MEAPSMIPTDVARKLGYYVYILVNPLDGRVFYVGKGRNKRALAHLQDTGKSRKTAILRQIKYAGKAAQIEILAYGVKTADTALRIEAAVIDVLGLPALTNEVRGWRSSRFGRLPLSEVAALYRRKRVTVREPAILIRINELYRGGMNEMELYDATRGIWKVGPLRERAKYAFAVFEGVIREVYEISHAYAEALKSKGLQVRTLIETANLNECPTSSTYTAHWGWDLALYMKYAEINVYRNAALVGEAVYDATWGGGRLDKFINAENKIRELVEELFMTDKEKGISPNSVTGN
jgi:uncharacterized protein